MANQAGRTPGTPIAVPSPVPAPSTGHGALSSGSLAARPQGLLLDAVARWGQAYTSTAKSLTSSSSSRPQQPPTAADPLQGRLVHLHWPPNQPDGGTANSHGWAFLSAGDQRKRKWATTGGESGQAWEG